MRYLKLYSPSIVGTLLFAGLWAAFQGHWPEQLADLLSPTSAAEALVPQFRWVIGWEEHYTASWWVTCVMGIGAWLFLLLALIQINLAQIRGGHRPAADSQSRSTLIQQMNGMGTIEQRHRRFILWSWGILLFPLLARLLSYSLWLHHRPDGVEYHDVHVLSAAVALFLIGLISQTVAISLLGWTANVGLRLTLLPWLPISLVILRLSAVWGWTEGGKAVLNAPTVEELRTRQLTAAPSHEWRIAGRPRLQHSRRPLVVLCASGGGSRAALFAAGILSRMWWQTKPLDEALYHELPGTTRALLVAPSSPGSDPAGAPPHCWYPGRLILDQADLISSVSGGSVAAAYLTESLYSQMASGKAADRHTALSQFFLRSGTLDGDRARPLVSWYGQVHPAWTLSPLFDHSSGAPPSRELWKRVQSLAPTRLQEKFDVNPYMNAMRQDFLASAVTGFLGLGGGRGPAVEDCWEREFRWYRPPGSHSRQEARPVRLSDFGPDEQSGRLPVLILNATLARTGTRLAITNLKRSRRHPLFAPEEKFGPWIDSMDLGEGAALEWHPRAARLMRPETASRGANVAHQAAQKRYDPLPGQVTSLNELDPYWDIPLQTAVRASANFPIGFPLIRFYRRRPRNPDPEASVINFGDPPSPDILEVTDGGLIDNSGLDSVMALLRAHSKEIKERGVLIFEIDSGELPRDPHWDGWGLLHDLTEPANAAWRANLNLQADLHSSRIEELRRIFGEEQPPQPVRTWRSRRQWPDYVLGYEGKRFAFFRIRAGELASEHVMTSWHLDARERTEVYRFICEPWQAEAIEEAAEWLLVGRNGPGR